MISGMLYLTLFALFAIHSSAAASGPVIDVGYAAYLGNDTLQSVVFFGGIPYAKPPLGDLRFRGPQRLDEDAVALKGMVTDARNWGPLCIQQPAVVGFGSEGLCLVMLILFAITLFTKIA